MAEGGYVLAFQAFQSFHVIVGHGLAWVGTATVARGARPRWAGRNPRASTREAQSRLVAGTAGTRRAPLTCHACAKGGDTFIRVRQRELTCSDRARELGDGFAALARKVVWELRDARYVDLGHDEGVAGA